MVAFGGQGATEVAGMVSELTALLSATGAAASLLLCLCSRRGEVTAPHLDDDVACASWRSSSRMVLAMPDRLQHQLSDCCGHLVDGRARLGVQGGVLNPSLQKVGLVRCRPPTYSYTALTSVLYKR